MPLKRTTIDKVVQRVMQKEEHLDVWDINIILWFFAKLESFDSE